MSAWFQAECPQAPQRDPRLDDAAAVAAQGAEGRTPDLVDLRFALRRAGVVDEHMLPLHLPDGDPQAALRASLSSAGPAACAMTHGGAAHRRGPAATTLILVRRVVTLDRPPALQIQGDELALAGALAAGFRSPSLLYSGPDGRVGEGVVTRRLGARFSAVAPLRAGPGRYRIEVLVEGPTGPTVAALFSVWTGVSPPVVPTVRLAPEGTPMELLAAERRRRGLPALRRHDSLNAAALAHSVDMRRGRWFGHRSPEGRGPTERLLAAGVRSGRVLENVAIAATPARAHLEVLESPGHLRNLLDPRVTHVGVGVHEAGGRAYVTWLFAELKTSTAGGRARKKGPGSTTP